MRVLWTTNTHPLDCFGSTHSIHNGNHVGKCWFTGTFYSIQLMCIDVRNFFHSAPVSNGSLGLDLLLLFEMTFFSFVMSLIHFVGVLYTCKIHMSSIFHLWNFSVFFCLIPTPSGADNFFSFQTTQINLLHSLYFWWFIKHRYRKCIKLKLNDLVDSYCFIL